MIAILIDNFTDPAQEIYYKKFTDKIYTTNKEYKYFDQELVTNSKTCDSFLKTNKIDGILKVNSNEKIKLLDLENFKDKTQFVCVSDSVWMQKKLRFFSNSLTNKELICQSIILQTDTNAFKHPVIDEHFKDLINFYNKKDYKKFVIESEKWIFGNSKENQKQVMLRYYCGLVYNFKLDNFRKSLEHLGIALILAPYMPELWCAWGDILLERKYYDKAEEIYNCACKVKECRDIFDLQPMWIDRNDTYPQKMLQTVKETVNNIQVISNENQNKDSSSFTMTVT